MVKYLNKGGNSEVESYELGDDYVKVKFKNSRYVKIYQYSRNNYGHVDQLKKHAIEGWGLQTYIDRFVGRDNCRLEFA